MFESILIVFSYNDELKGADMDLVQVYKFAETSNINIITDIQKNKKVDFDFNHVKNNEDFVKIIDDIFQKNPEKLFIYFSGHGKSIENNSYYLLPSGEIFMINDLFYRIKKLRNDSEIVMINDCCHLDNFNLFMKLKDNNLQVNPSCDFFPKQKIIVINSTSKNDQKAIMNHSGSSFSKVLFKFISDGNLLLSNLNSNISSFFKNKQKPIMMLSQPIKFCFPWLVKRKIYIFEGKLYIEK